MPHVPAASVLSRQNVLYAEVDQRIDHPPPDVGEQIPGLASYYIREWRTGPILTLARQMIQPPPPDNQIQDRWERTAAHILRLAHEAATSEPLIGAGDHLELNNTTISALDRELTLAHQYSVPDREKLKNAIRLIADPLLPRTHDELMDWTFDRITPALNGSSDPLRAVSTPLIPDAVGSGKKGKKIDARMTKELAQNLECLDWKSPQWAEHLKCSEGTVRETHTWKVLLPQARAMQARQGVGRMDQSGTHSSGRRGAKPL